MDPLQISPEVTATIDEETVCITSRGGRVPVTIEVTRQELFSIVDAVRRQEIAEIDQILARAENLYGQRVRVQL